jgi:hypothetical protein
MLPREFIEEFFGRPGAAGLHVLQTLPDRPKGLLIILSLPFEVFGQDVVERVTGVLSTPPRKLFEFSEPLGLNRQCLHGSKVELRE